jgi:hypothetical protein
VAPIRGNTRRTWAIWKITIRPQIKEIQKKYSEKIEFIVESDHTEKTDE